MQVGKRIVIKIQNENEDFDPSYYVDNFFNNQTVKIRMEKSLENLVNGLDFGVHLMAYLSYVVLDPISDV